MFGFFGIWDVWKGRVIEDMGCFEGNYFWFFLVEFYVWLLGLLWFYVCFEYGKIMFEIFFDWSDLLLFIINGFCKWRD